MSRRLTNEEFIERSNIKHNCFYDYSKVVYINSKTKVIIICPIHGEFEQRPDMHMNQGQGCYECGLLTSKNKQRMTLEEFLKRAFKIHGDKYDYSEVVYVNLFTKVKIFCKVCEEYFYSAPSVHINQECGCNKCAILYRAKLNTKTKEIFLQEINVKHDNFYMYDLSNYENVRSKIIVICPKHGRFEQVAYQHLQGSGCPICKSSIGSKSISKFLKNNNIGHISEKTFDDCKDINKLPFDFYLPELNIIIEFDGKQHYVPVEWFGGEDNFKYTQFHDKIKNNYCFVKGINLIRIPYWDKDNIEEILTNKLICK